MPRGKNFQACCASEYPDVFVGGATAWILEYIFGMPAHSQFIASQRMRFLENRERG